MAASLLLCAVPELDEDLVRNSTEYLSDRFTDGSSWGRQQKSIWSEFEVFLRDSGLIDSVVDVSDAYTNEFLP